MLRPMSFLAALLWLAIPSTPAYAQDQSQDQAQPPAQPSLGDVARQARKDKEKNAAKPKTVITDDTLPSGKGLSGLGDLGSSQAGGDGSAMAKALAKIDEAETGLKQLDAVDRTTLAKAVLLENDVDFPNRRAWEDRLYVAKEHYVSHERELIVELKQIVAQVQSRQASQGGSKLDPNDPRSQQTIRRVQEIIQDAVRTEQDYRAVVMEGWDLAKQAKH
jgi:hypothetical protein